VLTTAAGRGIGLEIVRQYAAEGWNVLACARSPEKATELSQIAEQSGGRVVIHRLDATDFAAIDELARKTAGQAIDVLINTAGMMGRTTSFGSSDYSEWERVFRLNTFAPTKMCEAFVQHVARSEQKKFVSLTTLMASIAKNELGAFYVYRGSKAALNAIMHSMSFDVGRKFGISVGLIHPGWVRTDMGGSQASVDVRTSVAGIRKVIAALKKENTGRFWNYDGEEFPW